MTKSLRPARLLLAAALALPLLTLAPAATPQAAASTTCSGGFPVGATHPVYPHFLCFGGTLGWARFIENPGYSPLTGPKNSADHAIYPALQPFEISGSRGAYRDTAHPGFRRVFHSGSNRYVYFKAAPEQHVNWYRVKNGRRSPSPSGFVASCPYTDSCQGGHRDAWYNGDRYEQWISHLSEWRYKTWGLEVCGALCDPTPTTTIADSPRLPLPTGPGRVEVRSFASGRINASPAQSIAVLCPDGACGVSAPTVGDSRSGYTATVVSATLASFTLTAPAGWREGVEYDLCNASGVNCATVSTLPTGPVPTGSTSQAMTATVRFTRATSQSEFFQFSLTGSVTIRFESWWIQGGVRRTATDTLTFPLSATYEPANRLPAGDDDSRFIVVSPVLS